MLPIVLDGLFKETLEMSIYARVNKDNVYSIKLFKKIFNQSNKYKTEGVLYQLTKDRWKIRNA